MKQKLLLFATLAITLLSSCKKNEAHENDNNIDHAAVQQVLNNPNENLQRSMFRLLNSAEKSAVWQQKYQDLLKRSDLSLEQRDFVKSLSKYVSNSKVFSKEYRNTTNENMEGGFRTKAITLFGESNALLILASLQNEVLLSRNEPELPDCRCSTSSDYCVPIPTDVKCRVSAWCQSLSSGCGTFWSYSCDGLCRNAILGA